MIDQVRLLTGGSQSDEIVALMVEKSRMEVCGYLKRRYCKAFDNIIVDIAVIKINRLGTEGFASQGYSGQSESYLQDYPMDIQRRLNAFNKKWGLV